MCKVTNSFCTFVAISKNMIEIITKYFPELSKNQVGQFKKLQSLYEDWNQKINVISRKDIDNLYEHHVLHSLAIAKAIRFKAGTTILDFGCGGGFPGIPLAIMFPECHFRMIDGTGKNALPNGVFCLKGGDLTEELKPYANVVEEIPLDTFFDEDWFKEEKKLIYLPL